VAHLALLVVEGSIVPPGVLVRRMAGCARDLSRGKTAALHQAQRLETDVFQLLIVDGRPDAMAIAAEADLLRRGEFTRITDFGGAIGAGVFFGSTMTANALNARHNRLQVARDGGSVAPNAALQITVTLPQAKSGYSIGRSAGCLPDSDAVPIQLREITDPAFEHPVESLN
jgi:hypothetical protein